MAINPKEFLNTTQELHALVIGMAEVVCFWPPRNITIDPTDSVDISKEYHYYQLGRMAGLFVWFGIAAIVKTIIT